MPWTPAMLYPVSLDHKHSWSLLTRSLAFRTSCFLEYYLHPINTATDGSDFKGERLTVQFARGPRRKENFPGPPDRPTAPRPRRTMFRMQISGLPETSWQVSSPSPFFPGHLPRTLYLAFSLDAMPSRSPRLGRWKQPICTINPGVTDSFSYWENRSYHISELLPRIRNHGHHPKPFASRT